MRARAGDPPRTMVQKILAARAAEAPAGELVRVSVDQVVLARSPTRALGEALAAGLKKTPVELALAYDGRCIAGSSDGRAASDGQDVHPTSLEMLAHDILVARAGAGFPSAVHIERFASPARVCITDEPRLAGVGGMGMLSLVVPTATLAQGLTQGIVEARVPVSVQIVLQGRLRPFVSARDVALELLRRSVGEVIQQVEQESGAPVVIEFAGQSARALSVGERGVLAAVAPQLGAAAALFAGDERTELFLRDQRRSKAHRVLTADETATYASSMTVDLGAVDPLLLDERGVVRAVRDLAGQPVSQVILGGDSGITLRDLFAVATLLKSKRVPPRLDFLLSVPSRQMLEVLASAGPLADLIATGARLVEPDARVVTGNLYAPSGPGLALRTFDPEPRAFASARGSLVASAETMAYAVATGKLGDPRAFKRPVRVTVPRMMPTDDVLIARKGERSDAPAKKGEPARATMRKEAPAGQSLWRGAQKLDLVAGGSLASHLADPSREGVAAVCETLDEVRDLTARAPEIAHAVRAVLAAHIPSGLVSLLSAAGIAALRVAPSASSKLASEKTIVLPAPSEWVEREATRVTVGHGEVDVTWLALGQERAWATVGSKALPAAAAKTARG